MIRILNAEPDGYSSEARSILASAAHVDERMLDRRALLAEISRYDALIVRLRHQVDKELLKIGSRLRAVASATTGLDHIDTVEAARRGVEVVSLKGETEFLRDIPATAELTWGLILSLTRHIPAAVAATRRGEWDRDAHIGVDLKGRTLGLVGFGRIGERVASYAAAFGMNVMAFDPDKSSLPNGVRRAESLVVLAAASDVLSVHVPLGRSTENLIDSKVFDAMRSSSYFINTARGGIVEESALIAALPRLAGAAVDVFSEERSAVFSATPLAAACRTHSNLIVTPHIGGASFDSMRATEVFIARKLIDVLVGHSGPAR
jgi:D-3-phosphoglycerate dehydrogenase